MKNIKVVTAAVFCMAALFVPSVTATAASCGETVSRATAAELQAIDCENNETIVGLLKPSRYLSFEVRDKKKELAHWDDAQVAKISDDQAIAELDRDNVRMMSDSFEEVQTNIEEIIKNVVDNSNNGNGETLSADFYINQIRNNKEKLLVGLAYLDRLYDFNMGEKNLRDMLLYESKPDLYGQIEDVLDWMIYIGGSGGNTLKVSNSANVFGYGKLFWPVTSSATLDAFLEEYRQKCIPDTLMNEWFLKESPAYIVDKSSSSDGKSAGIYKRLYDDTVSRAYILPLLTVSEDSIYVIANSGTITYGIVDCYIDRNLKETDSARYAQQREEFRGQLEQAAKQQQAFLDCWYRLAKPEKRVQLSSNRIVLDSLRIFSGNPYASAKDEWSDRAGENAARGVREFFTPLNLYTSYMFADGMAEGTGIRYYVSKALTERGLATYAHELTHMLVSKVMLNGYGIRDGMQAEVYARGMFEPYEVNDPPAFNLNLIYDRAADGGRYHNGVPERFQDETDLKNYMSGILDVVYTLDYAEADIILSKSAEEKKKWFHRLEQLEDSSNRYGCQGEAGSVHALDSVRELTPDEAEKLNSIDDLIRDSILVSRYEMGGENGTKTTGTLKSNGYYVVPLFSANYAGVQNDRGVSGDVMIRRQAFELLAEYGYYEGMVPYISNQYKESGKILSDQYILNKIFGGTYETMADFKKAMFQRRIEKTGELKPVTIMWKNQSVKISNFEKLRQLMQEAVESDLINVNVTPDGSNNIRAQATQVELLKQEIFKAYLIQTEDFSKSVYGAATDPEEPPESTDPEQPDNPGSGDSLVMSQSELKLHAGSGKALTVRKGAGGAAVSSGLKWSSSDASVASVDQRGNVKALKGGKARITVQDAGGQKASCNVTVENHNYETVTVKASLSKNGKTVKRCSVCKAETGESVIYYPKTIQLSSTKYVYNGKVRKPSVTVKDSGGRKLSSSNYRVSYASGRKKAGRYTVQITFKGNYAGTVVKFFDIRPKTTSISKLQAGRKSISVKWKKQSSQTTGYQIQYSVNKSFKKGVKTAAVGKVKTTSKKISKLKAGKKYYVRIRTYKTIKINKKSVKIYSDWSKAKQVKTK